MAGQVRFVLGGGGALGAFQAGALVALLEAGIGPDAVYGCSAGALNAAFLAVRPDHRRAKELAAWWADESSQRVLSPTFRAHLRGVPAVLRAGGRGLLHDSALRELVAARVPAHDLSELRVPVTVTTTCLDCAAPRYHRTGPLADLLAASCALPGLFAPVRLADGHDHVDGGVLCGVPVQAALDDAGPDDSVLVLDCGLAPVTGRADRCAAVPEGQEDRACGLEVVTGRGRYVAPLESTRGPLDVVLKAFTVARNAANVASVRTALDDPRVHVLPHVADAWAAGLLQALPAGPRDFIRTGDLVAAGQRAAATWLTRSPLSQASSS